MKQIVGLRFKFGGEGHSGWLPGAAALPQPTPSEDVLLTLQISTSDHGFLLEWWDDGKRYFGDTWHQSEEEAMAQAQRWFGVEPDQWQV